MLLCYTLLRCTLLCYTFVNVQQTNLSSTSNIWLCLNTVGRSHVRKRESQFQVVTKDQVQQQSLTHPQVVVDFTWVGAGRL